MKKYIIPILIVLCLIAYIIGYTTVTKTDNLELSMPASEDATVDWFDTMNANMVLIDAGFDDPMAYSSDTIVKADFADEDWGDLSVSSNSVTLDEDVVDATALKDGNNPADEDIFSYEATGTTGYWYSRDEVGIKYSKYDATEAPDADNDTDEGYVVGSNWFDITNDEAYVCLDVTDGAAVWQKSAPGGGTGSVDTSGTPVANDIPRFTDADTIEGLSYAELKAALDLEIGTDLQAYDAQLADIAALAVTDSNIIVGNGTNWVAESWATARTSLGLAIGTNVQAYDATLLSIAALGTAANKMAYTTDVDTWAETALTAFSRSILDDADEATFKATVNLEIGTDVEAHDATLTDIADGTITENLVNTANPWADNEVSDDITITAADTTDTTSFVALWETITGAQKLKSDAGLTYNAGTAMLGAANVKFGKWDGTAAPGVTNDVDEGYIIGSFWYDATNDNAYTCLDNTDGAAVWSKFAPSGGTGWVDINGTPVDNDFAKFTDADTIEGRSYSETRQDLKNYTWYPQEYDETGSAGTSGDPYDGDCIDDAIAAASAGDTIYLKEGYWQLTGACTISKSLNLIGAGIGKTIIVTDDADGIYVDGDGDYVLIQGMTIDGDAQTDGVEELCPIDANLCDYLTVRDVEVKNAGWSGIVAYTINYGTYENIWTHDNYAIGFHPGTGVDNRNMYNTYNNIYAYNNGQNGFDEAGNEGDTDEQTKNRYNNIRAWNNTGIGIIIDELASGILTNSFAWDNDEQGLYFYTMEHWVISNCHSINNGLEGMKCSGIDDINFNDCIFKDNNVTETEYTRNIKITGSSTNVRFTNCQIIDDRGTKLHDRALWNDGSTITLLNCELTALTARIVGDAVTEIYQDSAGNIKMGNGTWTNYINITNAGVLTLEGTANIEGVTDTEFSYLDGVTSDIQDQFGLRYLKTEIDTQGEMETIWGDTLMNDLVDDTSPDLGGELDAGAHSIGFTQQSTTGDGTTTIDWTLGNKFKFTFGAQSDTFTFTPPTNPCNLLLVLIQDGTGSRTATWPNTVMWPSGTAPTLTTTAAGIDICSFYWDGTNYFGVASLAFAVP